MKKTRFLAIGSTLLAFIMSVSTSMTAETVSPEDAVRIASENRSSSDNGRRRLSAVATPQIAFTSTINGLPCYYVVNHGDNAGFTIVAGDDRLPQVLGYSDDGSFDADNIPCNVGWWLDSYTEQIALYYVNPNLQKEDVKHPVMRASMKPIEPLTKTKWNQDAPYNDLCPLDNGHHSVTGCVATAMAQVMKVYEWPLKPVGNNAGVTFDGTTYQWDQMLDVYKSGQYNSAQGNAVATLMRQCGAAVNMMYSAYESGAYSSDVQKALFTYFGYSKSVKMKYRDYYSFNQWNQMVYDELAQGRPLYYSGQASTGGHAFVCDGYRGNDYFHFNWGWGGAYDGYFLLNALNPGSGGIGSHEGGYNSNQMILIDVKKADGEVPVQKDFLCNGGFTYKDGSFGVINTYVNENIFYNPHSYQITCATGVKITSVDNPDNVTYVTASGGERNYASYQGFSTITVAMPTSLPDGEYRVTPATKPSGEDWIDIPVVYNDQTYVALSVKNGQSTLSNPPQASRQAKLIVNGIDYPKGMQGAGNFVMNIYISNVGDGDYFGEINTEFYDSEDDYFRDTFRNYVSLPEKRTSVVALSGTTVFDGIVDIDIKDRNGNLISHEQVELAPGDLLVNESEASAGQISPNFSNTLEKYSMSTVVGNRTNVKGDVTIGLDIELFKMGEDTNPVVTFSTEEVTIPEYQSISFASAEREWTIPAGSYYWIMHDLKGAYMTGPWPLKLVTGPMTVDGVSYYISDAVAKEGYVAKPEDGQYKGNITVPTSMGGTRITEIEYGSFTFADELKSVTLPAGIKSLNPAEFYCTDALETLGVNANEPPAISENVMPEERFAAVALSVPDGRANIYKRTEIWENFLMPSWGDVKYTDGCEYVSGFATGADGAIYAPYYVSPKERPVIVIKVPDGQEVFGYYFIEGDSTEYGFWGGDGSNVKLPALGRNKATSLTFTTIPHAGVETVRDAAALGDVYDVAGVMVKTNASEADVMTLPAGVYIYQGKKVVVK